MYSNMSRFGNIIQHCAATQTPVKCFQALKVKQINIEIINQDINEIYEKRLE